MNKYLKNTPFAISGVMLGTASLGNLLGNYSQEVRYFLGLIAFLFWLAFVLRFIFYPKLVFKELESPGNSSIAPTFTMGSMVLVTYIAPFVPLLSSVIWYLLILLQMLIMTYITYNLILKDFKFTNVVPGWFVAYVGTGIIPVTAPNVGHILTGQLFLGFSLVMYAFVLPFMIYRLVVHTELTEAVFPSIIIFAAPASLCLTGYINTYDEYNLILATGLQLLAIVMIIFAIFNLNRIFANDFYPSFAGLTFPFVISATAITEFYQNVAHIQVIGYIALFETILAIVMVLYVIIAFLFYIFNKKKHVF